MTPVDLIVSALVAGALVGILQRVMNQVTKE